MSTGGETPKPIVSLHGEELSMDREKRKALEAAGWRVGTVQDFLGLTDEESQIVELRAALALQIRKLRKRLKLTQEQFARRINSSQSRVAKVEAGAATVSLDLMFRGFFAAGGKLSDLADALGRPKAPPRRARPAAKARTTIPK
jgi:DNA-binding XRE family transcriptional regulator